MFECDLRSEAHPLPHAWEHTVGSGHATLALRADWQRQLTRCHRDLGFQHVRFHGILSDDVGTLVREKGKLIRSFFNADRICDFLISIGMRPFVELSFMPTALASGEKTVFHYRGNVTPPADYRQWEALIGDLAGHWVQRYGVDEVQQWLFEVWNEPNLKAFWTGNRADYVHLYRHAARALKAVSPKLQVGGPATAQNAWIPAFLDACRKHQLPVDFVSTHHYPTDAFGKPGDDTVTQLSLSRRSVLRDQAVEVRRQAGDRRLYYTEWSSSSNPFDPLHDEPYAAAFIVKTVMEARDLVQGYSYWTFSDLFEEDYFSSAPFHGGFGLLTIDGVPKPAYRAFEFLHRLGDEGLPLTGSHPTVDAWVTRRGRTVTVLVSNWALPRHAIAAETVRLALRGAKEVESAFVERIDGEHANVREAWTRMSQPPSLSAVQVEVLERASALVRTPIEPTITLLDTVFELSIPPQGTVLLTLEVARSGALARPPNDVPQAPV